MVFSVWVWRGVTSSPEARCPRCYSCDKAWLPLSSPSVAPCPGGLAGRGRSRYKACSRVRYTSCWSGPDIQMYMLVNIKPDIDFLLERSEGGDVEATCLPVYHSHLRREWKQWRRPSTAQSADKQWCRRPRVWNMLEYVLSLDINVSLCLTFWLG